jgi:pentose-5-phosphate-3-epimerase
MEIIPAIMPISSNDLEHKAGLVYEAVAIIQIDVLDGKYVGKRGWPYWHEGYSDDFAAILREEKGLPFWKEVDYEVDLMIDPAFRMQALHDWSTAGAMRVIFHLRPQWALTTQSTEHEIETILALFNEAHSFGPLSPEVGIALHINDDAHKLAQIIAEADVVQCMGINHVGYQHQRYDSKVLDQIRAVREIRPDVAISVDGGFTPERIADYKKAGVARLIVGSYIFENEAPAMAVAELKRAAR